MKPKRSLARHLFGFLQKLVALAVLWLVGVAVWIIYVGERDQAADAGVHADAIVVLGAAAYDAVPSPVLASRVDHGIALYRAGNAPTLIFTGGFGTGARFAESEVSRRYAIKHGVPANAILIEKRSRTTYTNLIETRALMREHGLHRAIIVSDPLHMARALRLCHELGIDALGSPTPSSRFRSFRTRWQFLLREVYFFHRDLFTDKR
ncbi:YdcF family protein [Luteimonas panaciterrae]|uniref:YdcF family protein n=1 Tax=Luteimonas panaciterrae TaxID=363885 RepID=UPI001CFA53AE|nr:YdcF family protein [Luteimonas panaciterrae]